MLRDRFVCGLRNESIQKKLLTEEDLSYEKVFKVAVSYERAEEEAAQISMPAATSKERLAVNTCRVPKPSQAKTEQQYGSSCEHCGRRGHEPQHAGLRMLHVLSVKEKDT